MVFVNGQKNYGFSKQLPKADKNRIFLAPSQVHGSLIKIIDSNSVTSSQVFNSYDGVLYKQEQTSRKVCLYVKTADCLPILIYSDKAKILGAVHMGYQSAYKGILDNLVDNLTFLKVNFQDLTIVFGPCINGACYNIPMARFKQFQNSFNNSSLFLFKNAKNSYLSLNAFAYFQLRSLGIPKGAFSWRLYCTHCQADKFYSFRRGDRNHNLYSYLYND